MSGQQFCNMQTFPFDHLFSETTAPREFDTLQLTSNFKDKLNNQEL